MTRTAPKSDIDQQIPAEQISFLHRPAPFNHFMMWHGGRGSLIWCTRDLKSSSGDAGATTLAANDAVTARAARGGNPGLINVLLPGAESGYSSTVDWLRKPVDNAAQEEAG